MKPYENSFIAQISFLKRIQTILHKQSKTFRARKNFTRRIRKALMFCLLWDCKSMYLVEG